MSESTCQFCNGPLYLPIYEDGVCVDVVEPVCVAYDEMCRPCFVKLLETLENNFKKSQSLDGQKKV